MSTPASPTPEGDDGTHLGNGTAGARRHAQQDGEPGTAQDRRAYRRHQVALAAKDTLGVGMGYLPLGAAFGVLLATSGLQWWWAPVFSVLIYAGSMEFLAIGLVTGGVGLAQVAATTFFVNFRHVFYG